MQFLDLVNADRRREDATGGDQLDDDINEDVGSLLDEQADVALQLVPPIFSKNDKPAEYSFRDQAAVSLAKGKYTRKIKWGEAVPESMSQELASDADVYGIMSQYREELERVFARRPVWSAAALRGTLATQHHAALKALSLVAFTYTDGPWRRLWIRFGYDPASDRASYIYQMVDFRVPVRLWPVLFPGNASLDALNPGGAGPQKGGAKLSGHLGGPQPYRRKGTVDMEPCSLEQVSEDKAASNKVSASQQVPGSSEDKLVPNKFSDLFRLRCVPNQKQCVFQVGDVDDASLQQFLSFYPKPCGKECDKRYGWFSAADFQTVTQQIHAKFLELVKGYTQARAAQDAEAIPAAAAPAMPLASPAQAHAQKRGGQVGSPRGSAAAGADQGPQEPKVRREAPRAGYLERAVAKDATNNLAAVLSAAVLSVSLQEEAEHDDDDDEEEEEMGGREGIREERAKDVGQGRIFAAPCLSEAANRNGGSASSGRSRARQAGGQSDEGDRSDGGAQQRAGGAQAFVQALTASAQAAPSDSAVTGGVGGARRGIEALLSDVLASASVAADSNLLPQDLSDFEILEEEGDDSEDEDEDEDDDEL